MPGHSWTFSEHAIASIIDAVAVGWVTSRFALPHQLVDFLVLQLIKALVKPSEKSFLGSNKHCVLWPMPRLAYKKYLGRLISSSIVLTVPDHDHERGPWIRCSRLHSLNVRNCWHCCCSTDNRCDVIPPMEHATVDNKFSLNGTVARYTCDDGYWFRPPFNESTVSISCNGTSWSTPNSRCTGQFWFRLSSWRIPDD